MLQLKAQEPFKKSDFAGSKHVRNLCLDSGFFGIGVKIKHLHWGRRVKLMQETCDYNIYYRRYMKNQGKSGGHVPITES